MHSFLFRNLEWENCRHLESEFREMLVRLGQTMRWLDRTCSLLPNCARYRAPYHWPDRQALLKSRLTVLLVAFGQAAHEEYDDDEETDGETSHDNDEEWKVRQ